MGNQVSTTYLEETPPWDEYIAQGWRSERCRELDRLGGLNRPAIARGQSFSAKLQFLAEQVKKQGDAMQEMLLPASVPKEEAKYTGFMLATEKRAYERMLLEQERATQQQAKQQALESAEAEAAEAEAALSKPGFVYDRGGHLPAHVHTPHMHAPMPMPKPPSTAAGGSRARRPQVGGGALAHPAVSANGLPIAAWRIRMWHARRRVMLIVLTVLRLRRGKTRRRGGNKLDNLGFMIHRVLADDVGRFVEEQRQYAAIKEELEGAKQALDDMLCRNSSANQMQGPGALAEETSWPANGGGGPAAVSRQPSMARIPSLSPAASVPGGSASRAAALSTGRLNSRSRGSDSGVLAAATAALHNAGVSPLRIAQGSSLLGPGSSSAPPAGAAQHHQQHQHPHQQHPQQLGVISSGTARLSASGLLMRLGMAFGAGGAPDEPPPGPTSPLNLCGSPRSSFGNSLGGMLLGNVSNPGAGGGASGGGGGGGGKLRRTSTPGGLSSPGNKDSPPASREASMTQQVASTLLPSSPSGRRTVVVLPPTPTSVTAQLSSNTAAAAAAAAANAGVSSGLSSMAARRFNGRTVPNAPVSHPTGLITTNSAGPLTARVTVTSAVAAKHGQIMQMQAQIDTESSNLKKSGQMLSMYINRANAAWAEAQAWGNVDAAAVGEVEAFCYSEQYRIYQADLVRRLRQGSICLQVFAGDDTLSGTEKRPGSSVGYGSPGGASVFSAPVAVPTPPEGSANGGKPGGNGRSRQLLHADSGGSTHGGLGGGGGGGASAGGIAVSGLAAPLLLRRRQQHDLWTSDPWELINRFRPGIMPQTDRIQGPSMGARILCQLVLAVEQLAGEDAKAVMPVLLHINEEQMEEVVQELWSYRFFGLKRENVILVASPLHSGYRFNHELKVFEKDHGSSVAPLGSGYSLLQLMWAGEAFVVGPEGAPEVLDTPALTLLQERKVEWLVARRARDLALLSREAILDLPTLAYCMALKDRSGTGTLTTGPSGGTTTGPTAGARANILVEVAYAESLVDARALDSFVMQRLGPSNINSNSNNNGVGGAADALRSSTGSLPALTSQSPFGRASMGNGPSSPFSPGGGGGGAGERPSNYAHLYGYGFSVQHHTVPDLPSAVIELRLGELGTPRMIETLNYLRGVRDGQVPVGLGRYLLHVPSLPALLPSASALRPKLSLHEELVRVSLDLGDITAAPRARTIAVHARCTPGVLLSADDLEKIIPLLQAQDHDLAFRDMLTANRSEAQSLNFVASQASADNTGGQAMVVFVVNNRVSAAAVDAAGLIARPGRDRIHLVTCVSNTLQRADAEELLRAFQKRLLKSMVDTTTEVLVRGMWGLLDVMENYVTAVEAAIVVMGSQHLTSNDFNYVIGSITLSALKRLHVPVMVVTANSRTNLNIGGDWAPLGSLASLGGGGGVAEAQRVSGSGVGPPAGGPGSSVGKALRCLALVENHARNMLAFVCTKLLDNKRGDRLLLAQVQATRHLTRQQAASVRRALDNFNLMASGHGFSVNRVLSLEGQVDEVLGDAVGVQHIQVLSVALPQGLKTIPPALVNLLRSCRGVTLVYKEPVGAKQQQVPRRGFGPGSKAATALAAAATAGTGLAY